MKGQKFIRSLFSVFLVSGVIGVASQAHALSISPSTTPVFTTNQTSALTASEVASAVGYMGTLGLAFKKDEPSPESGNGALYDTVIHLVVMTYFRVSPESGNGAPYYTASFSYDMDGEPIGATIAWDGPLFVACPSCYLVVKDGTKGNPAQYVFNISGWNGKDTINLSGFWPGPGAMSNVAIWNSYDGGSGGGTIAAIPEADTYAMLLAGLGLVGFAARRKLGKMA